MRSINTDSDIDTSHVLAILIEKYEDLKAKDDKISKLQQIARYLTERFSSKNCVVIANLLL